LRLGRSSSVGAGLSAQAQAETKAWPLRDFARDRFSGCRECIAPNTMVRDFAAPDPDEPKIG
jgi:hypothetical protein